VLAVVALAAWLAVPERQPTTTRAASRLGVRDVYQRLERAVTRPGSVYHQTESVTSAGLPHAHQTVESWVDTANDVARQQTRPPGSAQLLVDDHQYVAIRTQTVDAGNVPPCHGTSPALALIVNCPAKIPTLNASQHVETAMIRGRAAVVLVTQFRPTLRAGQPPRGTTRLYLDAKSFLPIAARTDSEGSVTTGTGDAQGTSTKTVTFEAHRRSTFEHVFTPTEILPPDFFTPASIGAWAAAPTPD
jgi:hypothetical protein